MGHTKHSHDEILAIIDEMKDFEKGGWKGTDYNVVRHNCCHFSEAFLKRLDVPRPFPKWVNKMAKMGSKIEDKAHAAFEKAHHVEEKLKQRAHQLSAYFFGSSEKKKKQEMSKKQMATVAKFAAKNISVNDAISIATASTKEKQMEAVSQVTMKNISVENTIAATDFVKKNVSVDDIKAVIVDGE